MSPRCIVFGGTGDIGGAISGQLVDAGWAIVTVSRHISPSSESSRRHVVADVEIEASVMAAVQQIRESGSIHAVVYSVGLTPDIGTALFEYKSSDWRRTFGAYVDGLFYVYKAIFPWLEAGGHFFVISSAITGFDRNCLPPFHAGHYAAAKAAVDEFSKWARREAHGRGMLFSRLAPGSVRSAASAVLGIPEGNSLPLEMVAQKAAAALLNHVEIDEEMLAR